MATVPVKAQTTAASVQRPGSGPTGLTVASLPATASPANKPATSSPGSSAPSASPAAVIQNVTGQNIIKQVGGHLSVDLTPLSYSRGRFAILVICDLVIWILVHRYFKCEFPPRAVHAL